MAQFSLADYQKGFAALKKRSAEVSKKTDQLIRQKASGTITDEKIDEMISEIRQEHNLIDEKMDELNFQKRLWIDDEKNRMFAEMEDVRDEYQQ